MSEFAYPSQLFPALTSVVITMPDGWSPDHVAGALIAAFDPASPAHFRANVLVGVTRQAPGVTLDDLVADSQAELAEDPTGDALGEERIEIDGRSAVIHLQTRRPGGVNFDVLQAECLMMVAGDDRPVADLVMLHATCAVDGSEHYVPLFRAMIDSLRVTG